MAKPGVPAEHKLNYRLLPGRRTLENDELGLECIDVEWTHTDGPVEDHHTIPMTHPPDIQYKTELCGKRVVIKDQVTVKQGTPDSIVMQILEEKRERLAKCLGVES